MIPIKDKNKTVIIFLAFLIITSLPSCNHGRPCMRPNLDLSHEPYGATDINTISGNRGLSVGFNEAGTITVFKWPNPSYYDHVKYMTTTRDAERLGALPNEGVFSGIFFEGQGGRGFFWLRDIPHRQKYSSDRSVAVVTTFKESRLGLTIEQTDFVAPDSDILWRHYKVIKTSDSKVEKARLVSYANFNPQVSKYNFLPLRDWCLDELGSSTLEWHADKDLFVQFKEGKDYSTKKPSSVYLAYGFEGESQGHQAGYDFMCSIKRAPQKRDAFGMAGKADFPGSEHAHGEATAGLVKELVFNGGSEAEASLLIAAAGNESEAVRLIEKGRAQGYITAVGEVEKTWRDRLANVPVPATDDDRIRRLALRSVIVIYLGYAKDTGAGVASISTQPPYGLDWPRDGVYMNLALQEAGFPELSRERNLFWSRVQSRPGYEISHVPEGNWASNYYADGRPGFPMIWWEIDETGRAVWGMVNYYQLTGDRAYLAEVYPSIKLAADFMAEFRDPKTGLHKKAFEDDNPFPRQTTHGAVPVYMGLKYAAIAAEAMGDRDSKDRWEKSADEMRDAIIEQFYDADCSFFVSHAEDKGSCSAGPDGITGPAGTNVRVAGIDAGLMIWPSGMLDPGDIMADQAAEQLWRALEPSFIGERDRGMYEVWGLLLLAKHWKDDPEKLKRVKQGLDWEASVPISESGHFGEVWLTHGGKIIPGEAQPHLWHHALFYLAAIETYGAQ